MLLPQLELIGLTFMKKALFITVTFGGTATFLPLYTIEKGLTGIQGYFFLYALALIFTRMFAGKIYDQKGHQAVFIPSTLFIVVAMLLLAWMPSNMILYMAAIFYGIGFGAVQPDLQALQAWSLEHAARNRKGMANATFYSFFDLGTVSVPSSSDKLAIFLGI